MGEIRVFIAQLSRLYQRLLFVVPDQLARSKKNQNRPESNVGYRAAQKYFGNRDKSWHDLDKAAFADSCLKWY